MSPTSAASARTSSPPLLHHHQIPPQTSLNNHRNPVSETRPHRDRASRPHQARAPRLRDPLPPQDGLRTSCGRQYPASTRPALRCPLLESKAAEKTAFDLKQEKFDAAAKIKIIKEVRSFTDLGLKEAKELVEKRTNRMNRTKRTNRKPCLVEMEICDLVKVLC
ncbi:hypothetical protein Syun_014964 [Stephania yunnanensis]|uniref:Large ribosomal subunit protein bL12 C-terminal domain-containing protein n=1 Tax=Stephania yunnanensis TaxID=152371 RepID=A0AAP0JKT4_9MAGN